jgi:hypothetical protein
VSRNIGDELIPRIVDDLDCRYITAQEFAKLAEGIFLPETSYCCPCPDGRRPLHVEKLRLAAREM